MAAGGLSRVHERMALAARRAGRSAEDVTLVVVTKGHMVEEVLPLYEAGHRDFGENRPEELAAKAAALPGDVRWHLVGTVQRRKVRLVGGVTYLLHSLDRSSLARRWADLVAPPPVLVQVNVAAEPQKHGVAPREASGLVAEAIELGIEVRGLMTIPPLPEEPEDSRPWFRALAALRDEIAVDFPTVRELSMGMTDDFEVAIEEGASLIRVGRAIFGGEAP